MCFSTYNIYTTVQTMKQAHIYTPFDRTCIAKGVPGFLNEGSLCGATVTMATYMIQIALFHKKRMCLVLCYNTKSV